MVLRRTLKSIVYGKSKKHNINMIRILDFVIFLFVLVYFMLIHYIRYLMLW